MNEFIYESAPGRVVFGKGTIAQIANEVILLGASKAIIISTPGRTEQANQIHSILGNLSIGVLAKAVEHVPVEIIEDSLQEIQSSGADVLVAFGGGSSIGLAKAIAKETALPILAVPTSYAGSEMTPVWGITKNGVKQTGNNLIVKPKTVIYDPELTLGLPKTVSVTSGFNAVAHCVEGLYAEKKNPITSLIAEEGIRAILTSLPKINENPEDVEGRSGALYGSWLSGAVLASVGMALHHKLCHVLGGTFRLPHALTHTVILPYVIAYNFRYIPEAMQAMARALQVREEEVSGFIYDLAVSLGISMSLEELGLKEADLDLAAELATKNTYYNPRIVDLTSIRALLQYAFEGERPVPELLN
ncbi:maleylacetate reductase [Bacillus oleivorans]|uniref:Maleylacetate reductase n=1 Tax=Bacillus oleivorans TaxID=1448271 RepID=A0A285CPH8_9BACI|nr:maleylacetate reductase [Bacillus oleivorans]SNX68873.1 maleylacetate reductase [Bacillus oleivorans]